MESGCSYLRLCVVFCIVSLSMVGCKSRTRESVWNGSWKLNASRSQSYGSYFTVGIAPTGVVTVTNEANSFSFRCNGSEFQNGAGHTTVCTPANDSQWRLTGKSNGKDSNESIWDISPDGKVLTIRSSDFHPDGTQGLSKTSFTRRGGTSGFAGRWQDTAPLRSRPKTLDIALDGQHLHFAYPEIGQYSDSPLDGSIVPIHGPRVRPGSAMSLKAIGPREFRTQLIFSGHVIRNGTLDISEDGRTLLQETWEPEDQEEKDRLVYDKQ
jgi:hypothetical protein